LILAAIAAVGLAAGANLDDAADPPADAVRGEAGVISSQQLYIPAAAHVSGVAGADWRSDLEIYNLGPGQAFVEVEMFAKNQANASPAMRSFVISPGKAYRYRDIVQRYFGAAESAALRISELDDGLVVTSRTFNQTDTGTYGQFIGAVDTGQAITAGRPGRIIQLSQRAGLDSGYRSNLGLLNCTDADLSVTVDLYLADATPVGAVDVTLEPFMYRQVDRIFTTVTSDAVDDGFAVVSIADGNGFLFAYGSVVDNRTGDPIYIPAAFVVSEPVFIPAAANVFGAAGTDWRTDVELHNPGAATARYEISLLETGRPNSTPASVVQSVEAGGAVRLSNVLSSLFSYDGTGALRITPTAGAGAVITSRTYNQTTGGTYGQFLGAVPASQAIEHGEHGLMIQLTHHHSATTGFRTNLGFVNATRDPATVLVDLYRSSGALLGSVEASLRPYERRQLNRIFGSVTAEDVEDGFATITSPTPGSRVMAYASVVDNATGDPVYIPAVRFVPREAEAVMDPRATMYLLYRSLEMVEVEQVIGALQDVGLQGALALLAAEYPNVVTIGPDSFALDYGVATTLSDGNVVSGHVGAYFADVVIDSTTISGRPSFTFDGFLWNGQAPPVDTILANVDGTVDSEGHVSGSTTLSGTGPSVPLKNGTTLDGSALWDTLVCRYFPVGGTLTLEYGDERYTFTFDADCDGDFDYSSVTPGWDYTYAFGNPGDAHAQQHIASTENAEVWYYSPVWFWKPEFGGETLDTTPPGVITFKFDFDETVSEAHLKLNMPTFHWAYSRGYNLLYGSADGVSWELLMEVPPPEYGLANAGIFDADLPSSMTGSDELWLRAELYSYGERAPDGGEYTNTAELARWDETNPARSLQLDVRFAPE
jgi:hypothetical protein